MSKREIDALARVLADPENSSRTAEEVAERAIAQLDELRSRTARLAVVGQLQFQVPGPTHTVVLGPFSCRGVLDSQSKFERAVEGGTAARDAGWGLAWDAKTGRGRGRFMLAPAFIRPRDAYDFFRPSEGELAEGPWSLGLTEERLQQIRDSVARWYPGLWGEELAEKGEAGPACSCGVRATLQCRRCGTEYKTHCARRQGATVPHQCTRK